MVSRRISDISCNKEYFNKAAPAYNNALKTSGFNENSEFTSTLPPRRNRNRKMIWFNPPYSANVKTNISNTFLRLIDKHFPQHHKYLKLFNRNKLIYSFLFGAFKPICGYFISVFFTLKKYPRYTGFCSNVISLIKI